MPSTPTNSLRLEKQGQGEHLNTWGTTNLNTALDMIDAAVAGQVSIAVSGNFTLSSVNYTADQARNAVIALTNGGVAAPFTVTTPGVSKIYFVRNSSGQAATFTTGVGATVSVPTGQTWWVQCDGTNWVGAIIPATLDQIPAPAAPVNFGGQNVTGVGALTVAGQIGGVTDPTSAQQAATKAYVDNTAWGLNQGVLPGQAGNAGKYLTTDGATPSWVSVIVPAFTPQGRLTLTSGAPVMTGDVVAATTVYYAPYAGNEIPLYNGSTFIDTAFAQLSLALDNNAAHAGYHAAGSLFDLFVFLNAGVPTLGTGPAWTSTTARGAGAGTTELQQLNGIWTNKNATALRFGNAAGNTVNVAANQATYVGTMYATAAGQTAMQFAPAAASGGSAPVLGLWNAYNRVRVSSECQDSASSWTYASATWRQAHASANNAIKFVDGLQQSPFTASYNVGISITGPSTVAPTTAVGVNSTTAPTGAVTAQNITSSNNLNQLQGVGPVASSPLLGLTQVNALEYSQAGYTTTFQGVYSGFQVMQLTLSLEM